MSWLFMAMKKIDKNQTELGIKTHNYNVPKNHISRFILRFTEEVYQNLGIKEKKKKRSRPSYPICSTLNCLFMLKLTILKVVELLKKLQSFMIPISLL